MKELLFGNPGIPKSTKPSNTINGIKQVASLGLDAMEIQFTRSVNINETIAPEVKQTAKDHNVVLTSHGQYFVNLASLEPPKIEASMNRMLSAARRLHECGGWSIVWHFAFYQGRDKEKVYGMVKKNAQKVVKTLQNEGVDLWIRPETTGKASQWGDLDETIRLSQDIEQVMPCVDFSHLHARTGLENTTEEFRESLKKIEKGLGRTGLNNMHIHLSGIEYGPKGERNHLNLKDSDMKWKDLLKVWKEFKIKGVVTSESPNIEEDAMMIKKFYNKL
jgi:deoxyribonuclease-4